jgi:hypothetical protein
MIRIKSVDATDWPELSVEFSHMYVIFLPLPITFQGICHVGERHPNFDFKSRAGAGPNLDRDTVSQSQVSVLATVGSHVLFSSAIRGAS